MEKRQWKSDNGQWTMDNGQWTIENLELRGEIVRENIVLDKSKRFAVRIIKLYKYLCEEKKEFVLSKQILKSGTSIGANVRESCNAQSGKDFVNKLNIALKETDETMYWLEIMQESDILSSIEIETIYLEAKEIAKLLTSIIKTKKANISNQ